MRSSLWGWIDEAVALYFGLSVGMRYAVRSVQDLVRVAEQTSLSIYNRLSFTYENKTASLVYGTGKSVYVISLPELIEGLRAKGIYAKFCTANIQYEWGGKHAIRASVAISKNADRLDTFIQHYNSCISQSLQVPGVETGEWKELEELLEYKV